MDRNDLLEFMKGVHTNLIETTKRKNSDYAGKGGESPFANFTNVEVLGICSTETGFLTRMTDKLSRITSLVASGTDGEVKDESITDTLLDLANYSILLMAYLESKKGLVKLELDMSAYGEDTTELFSRYNTPFTVNNKANPSETDTYLRCFAGDVHPDTIWNETKGQYERKSRGFNYGF